MTPDGAYVVRSTRTAPDGRVTHELVDMAGRRLHATIPRSLTTDELSHAILRYAVTSRRVNERRPA